MGVVTNRYFLNINNHNQRGVDVTIQTSVGKRLQLQVNANAFQERYIMRRYGFDVNQSGNTLFTKTHASLLLLKNIRLHVASIYATRKREVGAYFKPWYYTDVSVIHTWFNNMLTINIKTNDIFQTKRYSGRIWNYAGFDGSYANWEKPYVLLGVSYNINKYNFTKQADTINRGAM